MKLIKSLILFAVLTIISCEVSTSSEIKNDTNKEFIDEENKHLTGGVGIIIIIPPKDTGGGPTHGTKPVTGPISKPGNGG